VKEYVLEGHRFVLDNTVVLIHRILQYPDSQSESNLRTALPPFNSLKLLDPSGAYILEFKLRVADGSNAALVRTGEQELERFQNTMQGVVELNVPDRLSLDTRVR
jgi:mediator of RNA polymerase II transcription subunit 18